MSIFIDNQTKVVVQGLTGEQGKFHALRNREYGTKVVAGTRPGKGGESVEGIPIFNTVEEAVEATGANTAMTFVPPPFAKDAVLEAAYAACDLIVCITEGIPQHDMVRVKYYLGQQSKTRIIGPNCPGIERRSMKYSSPCQIGVDIFRFHTHYKKLGRWSSTSRPCNQYSQRAEACWCRCIYPECKRCTMLPRYSSSFCNRCHIRCTETRKTRPWP